MSVTKIVTNSPAVRLVAYFVALALTLTALAIAVPWFRQLLLPAPAGSQAIPGFDGDFTSGAVQARSVVGTAIYGMLALVGALVFTIPVVWTYTVIMRQEGYAKSFVRMLSALPVVVAGVVQVVRGDLALAFALAGIVAAVRFRTTVNDLQDAVFAFAAIGIGLAAGTGNFTLAGAIATAFTALAYVLWQLRVGDVEPSLELSHAGVPLAEALVPGETHRAVVIGDDEVAAPVSNEDLPRLSESIDRLADYVRADALRKKKKYNTLLLVYTSDPDAARKRVEGVLDDHASRWVEVDEIQRNGNGVVALEYLMRLKKSVQVGKMIDKLGCDSTAEVQAAELKPIRGLRKRLT